METIVKKELLTDAGDVLILHYELLGEGDACGVRIRSRRGDWEERAEAATDSRETALRLLHLLAEAAVTPVTLDEILQELAKNREWTGLFRKTLV